MVKGACEVKREGVHGKGVCVAKGGMHGEVGACVTGGACVVGGVHDRGMTGRGHAWHRGVHAGETAIEMYASYWNTFLFDNFTAY